MIFWYEKGVKLIFLKEQQRGCTYPIYPMALCPSSWFAKLAPRYCGVKCHRGLTFPSGLLFLTLIWVLNRAKHSEGEYNEISLIIFKKKEEKSRRQISLTYIDEIHTRWELNFSSKIDPVCTPPKKRIYNFPFKCHSN